MSHETKKVLIVDDEVLISMFLEDVVEDGGYAVAGSAATPDEALKLAKAERPDIAIVDLNLRGGTDGAALALALMRDHDIAVILLSGDVDPAFNPQLQNIPAVAILEKPCRPETIWKALKRAEERIAS